VGWFDPQPPVDADAFDWLVAGLAWLHGHLGVGRLPGKSLRAAR